jgi:hypothetical protein
MAVYRPPIIPARPVEVVPRSRRLFDRILFRSALRAALATSRNETEKARDRSIDGASAAHEGMFKIECLGVLTSDITIHKDRQRTERIATLMTNRIDDVLFLKNYGRTVVSFEGQCYVVIDVTHNRHWEDSYDSFELKLRGVVL